MSRTAVLHQLAKERSRNLVAWFMGRTVSMANPTSAETGWRLPPEPLYVVAFLAPWALVSVFLPTPLRAGFLGLLLLLGLLLGAAGAWTRRRAEKMGLDGASWSFAAVVSLGGAILVLLFWGPRADERLPSWLCDDCGRAGAMHEPFCFGCGARP